MAFNKSEEEKLLVQTGRHCCLCGHLHQVQVHHIVPVSDGGGDDIDNAIPLCPNCHDQVHANNALGRTTKSYSTSELKQHRQEMIEKMKRQPVETPSSVAPVKTLEDGGALSTTAAYQKARRSLAASVAVKKVVRLALHLKDLFMSARIPGFFEGEEELGRRKLQAAGLSADGKTGDDLVWHNRWMPIHEASVELNKEALEIEVYFGTEAREIISPLQLLIRNFGIDLDMYRKMNQGKLHGHDPYRDELYKVVYNAADSPEADEFGQKVRAAADRIAEHFRPYL